MRYLVVVFTFLLSVTFYGQNDYSMSFDGVDAYVSIEHNLSLDEFPLSIQFNFYLPLDLLENESITPFLQINQNAM